MELVTAAVDVKSVRAVAISASPIWQLVAREAIIYEGLGLFLPAVDQDSRNSVSL